MRIKFLQTGLKFLRRNKLNTEFLKSEGCSVFHSSNPFIGDRFIFTNGEKLADGPKTLSKQLENLGYSQQDIWQCTDTFGRNRDFITLISAALKHIPLEQLKRENDIIGNSSNMKALIYEVCTLFEFVNKKPEALYNINGYGQFLKFITSGTGVKCSTSAILREGITDFKTVTNLLETLSRVGTSQEAIYGFNIPKIVATSKISKEKLIKLFDECLCLNSKTGKYETFLAQIFKDKILSEVNLQNEQQIIGFFKSLIGKDIPLNNKEFLSIVEKLHTNSQFELAQKLIERNDFDTLKRIESFIENGVLSNEYQCELFLYLDAIQKQELGYKFSDIAKYEILKNVRTEQDREIIKLMANKKSLMGRMWAKTDTHMLSNEKKDALCNVDLYDAFAIQKILEQSADKKVKCIEKLKRAICIDEEIYKQLVNEGFIRGHQCSPPTSPFQLEIRNFDHAISDSELIKKIQVGEVVQKGTKLVVSDGNKIIEIKLTKEMFEKLFITKAHLCQGGVGDCMMVATMDALSHSPKGRCYIYQLFEQKGNDVHIRFVENPNSVYIFKNGEYKNFPGLEYGANGMKMLEHAFAAVNPSNKSKQQTVVMYKDYLPNYKDLDSPISPEDVMRYIVGRKNYKYEKVGNSLDSYIKHKKFFEDLNSSNDNIALYNGKKDVDSWDILSAHCHNLAETNYKIGRAYIQNPHNASRRSELPLYEIFNPEICWDIDCFKIL